MKIIKGQLRVRAKSKPVVEYDHTVGAVYIRFSNEKVAETHDLGGRQFPLCVDLDKSGEVIGVEMVGMVSMSIKKLNQVISPHFASRIDLTPAEITIPQHAYAGSAA
jgi:uncharacterized protein YuzE